MIEKSRAQHQAVEALSLEHGGVECGIVVCAHRDDGVLVFVDFEDGARYMVREDGRVSRSAYREAPQEVTGSPAMRRGGGSRGVAQARRAV